MDDRRVAMDDRGLVTDDRNPVMDGSEAAMDDRLIAYRLQPPALEIVPGRHARGWMDRLPGRNAHRCLPLLMANQAGWEVVQRGRVTVTWHGGDRSGDCTIEADGCPEPPLAHFGSGIVTWRIPYLFRTPPGWNLLMRGPANMPKDGACSLEGMIESDWAVQPAFHSWKLTRPEHPVTWEDGEPICMVLPQRRGELESWRPEIHDLASDGRLSDDYAAFSTSRFEFNANRPGSEWQKHYFHGRSPGSAAAPAGEHQTKLRLRAFEQRGETPDARGETAIVELLTAMVDATDGQANNQVAGPRDQEGASDVEDAEALRRS